MKTINIVASLKVFIYLSLLLFLLTTSCKSQINCPPCPAIISINPNMNFKVVDKSSNKDLFFGSNAPYSVKQISLHHIINGRADTAFLRIDTLNHYFNVNIPTVHTIDTVTLQIPGQRPDILLFNTSITGKCCPIKVLTAVSYNGSIVYTANDGGNIVVLSK